MDLYDIFKKLKELSTLAHSDIVRIDNKVNSIIENNVRNTSYLESTYDDLFNYSLICYEEVLPIFRKLNSYVSTFNKELSNDYTLLFNDYFDTKTRKL